MTKDYYRILGVLDDAEDIVIRAAYKALAQRYHPDKWIGNKNEANLRMAEINEAYDILSDTTKRKKYDDSRDSSQYVNEEQDNYSEDSKSIETEWSIATSHFRDLDLLANELAKISHSLAFTFKLYLLENRAFDKRHELANFLQKNYLSKYFGNNEQILAFAKELILERNKQAAKELNKLISVVGKNVDANKAISQISEKYNTERYQKKLDRLLHDKNMKEAANRRNVFQMNQAKEIQSSNLNTSKLYKYIFIGIWALLVLLVLNKISNLSSATPKVEAISNLKK
jgi:curved DNA-binding protein CbpA